MTRYVSSAERKGRAHGARMAVAACVFVASIATGAGIVGALVAAPHLAQFNTSPSPAPGEVLGVADIAPSVAPFNQYARICRIEYTMTSGAVFVAGVGSNYAEAKRGEVIPSGEVSEYRFYCD